MITLHRLGHSDASLVLNCDLVATVEANPDTVITLVTGARLVVNETPEQVVDAVLRWRAEIGRHTFGTPKVVEPPADDDLAGTPRPSRAPAAADAPTGAPGLRSV